MKTEKNRMSRQERMSANGTETRMGRAAALRRGFHNLLGVPLGCGAAYPSGTAWRTPRVRFCLRAAVVALLLVVGGWMSGVWAQTYTYKVIDEDGTEVASATSTSSTLAVPDEIKAANCVFRFYDSEADAQNMTSTGERTTLPTGDATIYVGFRCDMRVFPTSTNGKSVYFVQQNNYQHWNDLKYNTGTDDFSAQNNNGDTWQFVGDSPYDVKITNGTYYIKVNSGDEIVHGTNDASQASHFVILHSSWNTSEYNYAFRLVGTSLYLRRINATTTEALKTTSTSGTQDTSFGMYSSSSAISPRYNIYDSYGNFVFSRYDNKDDWKLKEFRNFSSKYTQRTSNFNVTLENWISEMNFYVSVPDNANAVPVKNVPQNDVYDINVTYTPRWVDANNPGVMLHRDGSKKLDLTGNTRYFMNINRGNGHYMYADGTSLKFKDKSVKDPGATDTEYQWILEGGDPLHIILRSVVDGKVVSPSDFTIERSTPSGAGAMTYTMTPSTTPSISLKEYNSVDPINSNSCWVLMSYSGTESGGSPGEYLTIPGFSQSVCVINAYGNGGTSGNIDLWKKSGTSGAWDTNLSYAYITFEEVPKTTYTINIVDSHGHVAIKGTSQLYPTEELTRSCIPDEILSPYIDSETLTFYSDAACTTQISSPAAGSIAANGDIYVRYTTDHYMDNPLHLRAARTFKMQVNGKYIYDDGGTLGHLDAASDDNTAHLWYFTGGDDHDPYAVKVQNVGTGRYFQYATATPGLSLGDGTTNQYFIIMADNYDDGTNTIGIELMAATGGDASTAYYSVGRTTGDNDATLFDNVTHPRGDDELQILLNVAKQRITYHLIDKAGHELLSEEAESDILELPSHWQSPLVKQYHFWNLSATNDGTGVYRSSGSGTTADPYVYTVPTSSTYELQSPSESTDGNVYVTYTVKGESDEGYIDLNEGVTYTKRVARSSDANAPLVRQASDWGLMYRLEFTSSDDYYLEDGSDDVEETRTPTGTHIFPYTNGDGPMYIYTESRWDSQKDAAASTRTRWTWYMLSPTGDPYHVMVTSWQNSHANSGTNYYSFFRTYYNTSLEKVVTGNVTDDPNTVDGDDKQILPTEYMLLNGTTGDYKLLTTDEIAEGADNTVTAYGKRQTVTSFEQYWRNNPTAIYKNAEAKLGRQLTADEKNNTYKNKGDATEMTSAEAIARLATNGWHHYDAYVNAAPWNSSSRSYSKSDHWFMTVNVGDGSFNLLETDMNAALVLLDNHGWEVMRVPIYKSAEAAGQTDLYAASKEALKAYDSPMVSVYHYYTEGTKLPGYHKYTVSDSKWQADKNSLGEDYPQVYQGGMLRDLYVTYTVKEEYANAFTPSTTKAGIVAPAYRLQQGTDGTTSGIRFATTADGTSVSTVATDAAVTENMVWTVKPNFDIDTEMGYTGDPISYEAYQNGFDPYNLQFENGAYPGMFIATQQTGATLGGGQWTGTYSDTGITLSDLSTTVSGEGYDQTTLRITNATFMAVQDENGNMRLMPRFDHSRVLTSLSGMSAQLAAASANDEAGTQTTHLKTFPYTYHITILSDDGNALVEEATAEAATGATQGALASAWFPDELVRRGVPVEYNRYFTDHTVAGYTAATTSMRLNTKPDVYVRYTVDESQLPFTYSGTLTELRALAAETSPNLDNVLWHYWETPTIGNFQWTKSGELKPRQNKLDSSDITSDDELWWAFFGTPYDMRIINKSYWENTSHEALGVTNYPDNTWAQDEQFVNGDLSETDIDNQYNRTKWAYATFSDGENMTGVFFLADYRCKKTGYEGNRYYLSPVVGGTQLTADPEKQTVAKLTSYISPVTTYTYRVINLSGQQAITATDYGPALHYPASLPDIVRAYGINSYSYYNAANTELFQGVRSFTGSSQTTFNASEDGTDIYVKYEVDNTKASSIATKAFLLTVSGRYSNFMHFTEPSTIDITTNRSIGTIASNWRLQPALVDGHYDPYNITIYSFMDDTHPVGANEYDNSLTVGTDLTYSRFILQDAISGDASLLLCNSETNDGYGYLYYNSTKPLFELTNGAKKTINLWSMNVSVNYHIYDYQGRLAISATSTGIDALTATPSVPSSIKSPLVSDNDWQYWSTATDAQSYRNDGTPTPLTHVPDGTPDGGNNTWQSDVHVTYTYIPTSDSPLDLSGETCYNIHSPWGRNNTAITQLDRYWLYRDDDPDVRFGTLDGDLVKRYTDTYPNLLDDHLLWRALGNDPYAILLENRSAGTIDASLSDGHLTLLEGQEAARFILLECQSEAGVTAGDYELVHASGTTSRNNLVVGNTNYASTDLVRCTNNSYWVEAETSARVHFTKRSSDYIFNIINKTNRKALMYKSVGIVGKPSDDMPEAIKSPMAENFRFYTEDQVHSFTDETTGETVFALNAGEEENYTTVYPATTDADEATPLYVYYDLKADPERDLTGGKYYWLKADGQYVTPGTGSEVATAVTPQKDTQATAAKYLWMPNGGDGQGDPYDIRLQVVSNDTRQMAADGYEVGKTDVELLTSGDAAVEVFCLLPGNGTDGKYTLVAATGDSIQDNHFAYVGRDGSTLQLMRAPRYNRMNDSLQVELEVPVYDYRYRVVNHSDHIAIQQTVTDVEAGTVPTDMPADIKSPFADVTGFYLEGQYAVSGGDTYTLNANEQSIAYNGGLPYYNADIYVEYEYNGNEALELTGRKKYNMTVADNNYVWLDGSTITKTTASITDTQKKTDTYQWTLNTLAGGEIDPYQLTVTNVNTTDKTLATYIIMAGSDDSHYRLLQTNATDENYTYLTTSLTDGTTAAQVQFLGIPVKVYYAVLSKTKGWVAIKGDFIQEGGDKPNLPDLLRSPLAYDYKYYGTATEAGKVSTKSNPDKTLMTYSVDGLTELAELPYEETTVYVTYDFDNTNSLLDLNGQVKYNVSYNDNYAYLGGTLSGKSSFNGYSIGSTKQPTKEQSATKAYLWQLRGNDPYNVVLTNLNHPSGAAAHLASTNNFYNNGGHTTTPYVGTEFTGNYIVLNGSTLAENGYALVASFSNSNANDAYDNFKLTTSAHPNEAYVFFAFNDGTLRNQTNVWSYSNYPSGWVLGRGGQTATDRTTIPFQTLIFTPTQTQPVVYHLTQKITGTELEETDPSVAVRALIELPEAWERKYCDYTYTYYYEEDGITVDGETYDVPLTREEYEAGKDTNAQYQSKTTTIVPTVYIAVDDETQEPLDGEKLDIYVDYTVRGYGEENGLPFLPMVNTQAGVNALLANTGGIAEGIFDLSTYDKMMGTIHTSTGEEHQRKDYLYFMVMHTNNNYSAGSQYFLRREDTGRISWLNNGYKLYVANSRNVNQWSYSRCAESYRENDHDPFQEKNWLWCFAGDPYDMYIFNVSAVYEEYYNTIKRKTEYELHRNNLTHYATLTNNAGTTTEQVVTTPQYTDEENQEEYRYYWSLVDGKGTNSDQTFSLLASQRDADGNYQPNEGGERLYWKMAKSSLDNVNEVMLKTRADDFTGLDYNIQVLPYEPMLYEDVNLVVRRDDNIGADWNAAEDADHPNATTHTADDLETQTTGLEYLFFAAEDRKYVAGDKISSDDIPMEVERSFCTYKLYTDVYDHVGDYTVKQGPYRGDPQKDNAGNILYDENNDILYNYYGSTTDAVAALAGTSTPDKVSPNSPQNVYLQYTVTSDIFLEEQPTKAEVADMVENNDHVYFMDFTQDLKQEGYDKGYHAYFEEESTFKDNLGASNHEKLAWTGAGSTTTTSGFSSSPSEWNDWQFKTTANRMNDLPENEKWYFVGDPYKVQVFCTKGAWNESVTIDGTTYAADTYGANLARFIPEETAYQFVNDCVHLKVPTDAYVDNRDSIPFYESYSTQQKLIGRGYNYNKGKPYYRPFYWEVVPTTAQNNREGTFALRFKQDSPALGYTDVYYYLAGSLSKVYPSQNRSFPVNLSYDSINARHLSGTYIGYHTANNKNTIIRLIKPAKVYVSAYKGDADHYADASVALKTSFDEADLQTKDELTEYFGVDEVLADVPRHLKRKYTTAYKLQYKNSSDAWTDDAFSFDLSTAHLNSSTTCTAHPVGSRASSTPHEYDKSFVTNNVINPVFKLRFLYYVSDSLQSTTDKSIYERLFTQTWDGTSKPQWLDVMIGNRNWIYYDKSQSSTTLLKNYPPLVSDGGIYKTKDQAPTGWDTGIKGLHWAFIGDPYNFTAVNRRRWEDGNNAGNQWLVGTKVTTRNYTDTADSVFYYTQLSSTVAATQETEAAIKNSTQWSLVYAKTGGEKDVLMRTASLKQTENDVTSMDADNQTNDYWRLQASNYQYGSTSEVSPFVAVPFSLETKTTDMQKVEIRTAVAKDEDGADNDCFDANVKLYNVADKTTVKLTKEGVELRYGDVFESLPQTLRRYGCDYIECWVSYDGSTPVQVTEFSDDLLIGGKTLKEMVSTDANIEVMYYYTVTDDVAQFFTTPDHSKQDEHTWTNAYFQWEQTYPNIGQPYSRTIQIFDHYTYNGAGKVIDIVYRDSVIYGYTTEPTTVVSSGWLNSHTSSTLTFGNDRTQEDKDEQKWALVGDPYGFELKNYATYLLNYSSTVSTNGELSNSLDITNGTAGHWALAILPQQDANGNVVTQNGEVVYSSYLAYIDENTGEVIYYVTFDRTDTSGNDLSNDQQYLYLNGQTDPLDPTANKYDVSSVKPFFLANLRNYAAYVIYHLVIAHQHSLDYEDSFTNLSADDKQAAIKAIDKHLAEWLKYKYPDYMVKETTTVDGKNYEQTTTQISGTYTTSGSAVEADGTTAFKDQLEETAKTGIMAHLKQASMRDFISHPVLDDTLKNVGIGNTLTVPWYMRRQFCNYTLYQTDVLRSDIDYSSQATDANGVLIWQKEENGVTTTMSSATQPAGYTPTYNVIWKSVTEEKSTGGYADDRNAVLEQNGKAITKLNSTHRNRILLVDVVYDVDPGQFRFSDAGRNTTAWYTMMTNNEQDGLMNFSYKDGIGARFGSEQHYTNNYLWAPVGDPYGFIMHNRYATINGTGWDNVIVTTNRPLTQVENGVTKQVGGFPVVDKNADGDQATYTGNDNVAQFVEKRIVHLRKGATTSESTTMETDAAVNAVYEMYAGVYPNSFLMHPTSSWVKMDGDLFSSYYMTHNSANHKAVLHYIDDVSDIRSNADYNWRLVTTADQLLPYFKRSGYVGGLQPNIAQNYQSWYSYLQAYKAGAEADFTLLDNVRKLVYDGKFYEAGTTTEVSAEEERPAAGLRFESKNLVNMKPGYFRLRAFSQDALDQDGKDMSGTGLRGIVGPRYISGYRFLSEKNYSQYNSSTHALETGSRWLHFFETDQEHATFHTFGDLNSRIKEVDEALPEGDVRRNRDIYEHPAMRGNIEILPAEYDPSSIFRFEDVPDAQDDGSKYGRYYFGTQDMRVRGRAGGSQGLDANYGVTKLVDQTAEGELGYDERFKVDDIGGTAITLRLLDEANRDNLGLNMQTNYLCIDSLHRYRITIHKQNELKEIGDHNSTWTSEYGIQDTKWLLEPVGVKTDWPYNQVPLRMEVNEGGQKPNTADGTGLSGEENKDNNYYGSLYVPFDTRLASTIDVAFTSTRTNPMPYTLRLASVSQLNGMGNPQFIPAGWPVIVRSSQPKTATLYNESGSTYRTVKYVNLYLPNDDPSTELDYTSVGGQLMGQYLEQMLTDSGLQQHPSVEDGNTDKRVMVFGLPFVEGSYNKDKYGEKNSGNSYDYYDYLTDGAVGFYTNENWYRGHTTYSSATGNDGSASRAHLATARNATADQRDNRYVYHNKVYLFYTPAATSSGVKSRIVVLFDDEEYPWEDEDPDIKPEDEDIEDSAKKSTPWPCDVYDLSGRKVATKETPQTLRKNNPGLPKGVYIFGHVKVAVF